MDDVREFRSFCSTRSSGLSRPARFHHYAGWLALHWGEFQGHWATLESARQFAYGIQGTYVMNEAHRARIRESLNQLFDTSKLDVVKENLRFPRGVTLVFLDDLYWQPILSSIDIFLNSDFPPEDEFALQEKWNDLVKSCITSLQYISKRESFERKHSIHWERTSIEELPSLELFS